MVHVSIFCVLVFAGVRSDSVGAHTDIQLGLAPPRKPPQATPQEKTVVPVERNRQIILVDLKKQRVRAFEDGAQVYDFHCSTGRNNATPAGDWSIRQKARYNRALPKYGSVPIPYSLRLDIVKDGKRHLIAIHAFGSVPRYPASHGCIRLRYSDARKLFQWAKVGIPVLIRSHLTDENLETLLDPQTTWGSTPRYQSHSPIGNEHRPGLKRLYSYRVT